MYINDDIKYETLKLNASLIEYYLEDKEYMTKIGATHLVIALDYILDNLYQTHEAINNNDLDFAIENNVCLSKMEYAYDKLLCVYNK